MALALCHAGCYEYFLSLGWERHRLILVRVNTTAARSRDGLIGINQRNLAVGVRGEHDVARQKSAGGYSSFGEY